MCRIAGFLDLRRGQRYNKELTLQKMRDSLAYGGPDSADMYVDEEIALGHRRLSILDLSNGAKQPMHVGDWVIVYNGEVYNFKAIRELLLAKGYHFTTDSDTEVIIHAFDCWGKEAIHHFRGMFAFALWNKEEKRLLLYRDRVGVKPLYYYWKDNLLLFASELKAFHEHPSFNRAIDKDAVSLFLQQGYIHAPHCIYKYCKKLVGGEFLELSSSGEVKREKYWNVADYYSNHKYQQKNAANDATEELEELLKDSFKLRMVADVPVGMFLSGGIDSSLVTSMLQKESNKQLKTFTIGFDDPKFNEAIYAEKVAQHIGSDHTTLYCTQNDFVEVLPKLADFYDEPFGDSSAIPTYLVSKLAKESVTVSLSADGGDELFGGYTKYDLTKQFANRLQKIPYAIRKGVGKQLDKVNPIWLSSNLSQAPIFNRYTNIENKFYKFRKAFQASSTVDFFNLASSYLSKEEVEKLTTINFSRYDNDKDIHPSHLMSFLGMIDIETYLEGDIMTKVDRASMQVALEGREPLLDHHLIEWSMGLPDELKWQGSQSKYLLRKILYKYVPKELIERPKQGFAVPIEQWLSNELRDELEQMLRDVTFFDRMYLNRQEVSYLLEHYFKKTAYVNTYTVWFIWCLYSWYLRWEKN